MSFPSSFRQFGTRAAPLPVGLNPPNSQFTIVGVEVRVIGGLRCQEVFCHACGKTSWRSISQLQRQNVKTCCRPRQTHTPPVSVEDLTGRTFGAFNVLFKESGRTCWSVSCTKCGHRRTFRHKELLEGPSCKKCLKLARAEDIKNRFPIGALFCRWRVVKILNDLATEILCECICGSGKRTTFRRIDLERQHKSGSCGCLKKEKRIERAKKYVIQGVPMTVVEIHEAFGVHIATFRRRLRQGWEVELAALTPGRMS